MRKYLKLKLSFFLVLMVLGCSGTRLTEEDIRFMEMQDHEQCLSVGIDVNPEIVTELYWKCRVRVINYRMENYKRLHGRRLLSKGDLKRIKKTLWKRAMRAQEASRLKVKRNIGDNEHKACIIEGHYLDFSDKKASKGYYKCRERLAMSRNALSPFAVNSYKESKEEKEEREKLDSLMEAVLYYQNCAVYDLTDRDFDVCINDHRESEKCIENIPEALKERKKHDKIFCTKQAAKKLPDSLALYDVKQESVYDETAKEGEKPAEEEIRVGPKFSKMKIVKLRRDFRKECLNFREEKLRQYKRNLPKQCEESLGKWK